VRTRYVQIKGELVKVEKDWTPEIRHDYHVMPDIKGYRSMADGTWVGSRSTHREMLSRNNCIEVGNDSSLKRPPKPLESPPGLKEKIIRAVNEVESRARRN
jgi:hypothetical protein